MESTHEMQTAAMFLLQLSPSILGAAFITAILINVITKSLGQQDDKKAGKNLPRKQVICGTVFVTLSNVRITFSTRLKDQDTDYGIDRTIGFNCHGNLYVKRAVGFDRQKCVYLGASARLDDHTGLFPERL